MDQIVINWALTGASAALGLASMLLGAILKSIWDALKGLRNDMHQLERDLPELYVRKDDYRESMHELKSDMAHRFDKLEDNLNNVFKYIDWRINDKQS